MSESQEIKETRRRREKQGELPSGRTWRGRNGLIALAATATLGAGLLGGGSSAYAADNPLGGLGLDDITGLLENEMIKDFIEICDNPDGSTPIPEDDDEVFAVVDCSQSTGTGIAVVLPESIEVGAAAEGLELNLPFYGDKNLIQIVSILALNEYIGGQSYSTYEQVVRDSNLPIEMRTVNTCTIAGIRYDDTCKKVFGVVVGTPGTRTYDNNLDKRAKALKVAAYLTGDGYDSSIPAVLPGKPAPVGTSTVVGPGMQLALSMTGGTALAETGHEFGIATAGAGEGRTSSSYAYLGMANALNLDTDKIELTWFGKVVDFERLRGNAIVDLVGGDNLEMLDTIEDLQIPALKEVSCFGVLAQATAEGLGSCSNILGTFDMYQDERAPVAGESRQTQYGLTDVTSLVLGNDALLKQLMGTSENTPFMDTLMDNLTSEEGRLKFAKDFVRFTQDVKTETVLVPALDDENEPILDENGDPVMVPKLDEAGKEVTTTITAAYLTSDYGFVEPITIEWMGQRIVLFPAVTVNGEERPNLLSLPQIERIVADADSGEKPKISLLPKISLVQWANPFGLGTLTLDKPFNPVGTLQDFFKTVTIVDDVKEIGGLVEGLTGGSEGETETEGEIDGTEQPGDDATDEDSAGGETAVQRASGSSTTVVEPADKSDTGSTDADAATGGTGPSGTTNADAGAEDGAGTEKDSVGTTDSKPADDDQSVGAEDDAA